MRRLMRLCGSGMCDSGNADQRNPEASKPEISTGYHHRHSSCGTVRRMDALPAFLLPQTSPDPAPLTAAQRAELAMLRRQNELTTFESAFERMMSVVETGQPLTAALEDYPIELNYTRFLAWVHKDENRKARYYEAQTVAAEVVAQQMLDIADASDTIEDVQRSTLRINTRKWLLGVWNRKRFGETRQIEQTVTIDLGEAMAAAQRRVNERRGDVIDVQGRTV